ncbi:helix-turn-helix domain-containing protein [Nocardioides sp.]|uniref:helix-turn-helix domain-containing protein n=1 Tax=Nocardioides sp. TaxID=35761 RepID=UPI0035131A77
MSPEPTVPDHPLLESLDQPYFEPGELADLLRIPKKTLANWRSDRKGPKFHTVGAHVRYPRHFVAEWLMTLDDKADEWMAS